MLDRNGKKIWDGDYVTNPVMDGIVAGKNPATALIKVMNVDTGHEEWVNPNHCTVVEDPDGSPNQRDYADDDIWFNEQVSISGYRPDGSRER